MTQQCFAYYPIFVLLELPTIPYVYSAAVYSFHLPQTFVPSYSAASLEASIGVIVHHRYW